MADVAAMDVVKHPPMQSLMKLLAINDQSERLATALDWINKHFRVATRLYSVHPNELRDKTLDNVHREQRFVLDARATVDAGVWIDAVAPLFDDRRTCRYALLAYIGPTNGPSPYPKYRIPHHG